MAQKPETRTRKKFRELLRQLEPAIDVHSIDQEVIKGSPDLLICANGWFVACEIKSHARIEPTPLQKHKLARIEKANGLSFVVHPGNIEEVYEIIKALLSP